MALFCVATSQLCHCRAEATRLNTLMNGMGVFQQHFIYKIRLWIWPCGSLTFVLDSLDAVTGPRASKHETWTLSLGRAVRIVGNEPANSDGAGS